MVSRIMTRGDDERLLAALRLRDKRRSHATIAQALGFSSVRVLRNTLHRIDADLEASERGPMRLWERKAAALAHAGNTCRFPGCGRVLTRGATSGVCRDHNHRLGFCGCRRCAERRERRAH